MTKEERKTICKYVEEHPEKTYDEIAKDLGVSRTTVMRACKGKSSRPRGRKLNLKVGGKK